MVHEFNIQKEIEIALTAYISIEKSKGINLTQKECVAFAWGFNKGIVSCSNSLNEKTNEKA